MRWRAHKGLLLPEYRPRGICSILNVNQFDGFGARDGVAGAYGPVLVTKQYAPASNTTASGSSRSLRSIVPAMNFSGHQVRAVFKSGASALTINNISVGIRSSNADTVSTPVEMLPSGLVIGAGTTLGTTGWATLTFQRTDTLVIIWDLGATLDSYQYGSGSDGYYYKAATASYAQSTVTGFTSSTSEIAGLYSVECRQFQTTGYRYFRFNNTDNVGYDADSLILEMQLSDDAGANWYPGVMTGASAPAPLVASANNDAYSPVWKLFDGSTAYYGWGSTSAVPNWAQIDFGAGVLKNPNRLRYCVYNVGGDRTPQAFTLQASLTGAFAGEETTLLTKTGLASTADGVYVEHSIP